MAPETRRLVKNEVDVLYKTPSEITINFLIWCESLRVDMKDKYSDIISKARETGNINDSLALFILFELVPRLTKPNDKEEKGENTLIKNYLEYFLDNVFSIDKALYQSW
ncbi:unnamed protein product [Rhizopus stolonifer]